MTLLAHALIYAARGWRVLPVAGIVDGVCTCSKGARCAQAGKHPLVADWVNKATTDPDTIRSAWGRNPTMNIGLATGERSGFFVLDVDVKSGGLNTMSRLEPLPPTLSATTGSGGKHYLFAHVPGLGNRANVFKHVDPSFTGVDVRGDGGQIVAPPSAHWSGGFYKWDDPEAEILPAPPWLLEALRPAAAQPVGKDACEWRDLFLNGIDEGGRNDAVAKVAGYLLRTKIDPYIVLDIIQRWNVDRVRPPLSEEEVHITVNSVAGKEEQRIMQRRRKK